MATNKDLTVGQRLTALYTNIPTVFRDGTPEEVAALSKQVHGFHKVFAMIRKAHDEQMDLVATGNHGADKLALFDAETIKYVRNPRSDREQAVKIAPDYSHLDC